MIKISYNLTKEIMEKNLKKLYQKTAKELLILSLILLIIEDITLVISKLSLLDLIIFNILTLIFCLIYIFICQKIFIKKATKNNPYFFGYGNYQIIINQDKLIEKNNSNIKTFEHKDIKKIYQKNNYLFIYYKYKNKYLYNIIEIINLDDLINIKDIDKIKEILEKYKKIRRF